MNLNLNSKTVFGRMNEAATKYCVLGGFSRLPETFTTDRILILTERADVLVKAIKPSSSECEQVYTVHFGTSRDSSVKKEFVVLQKGRGFAPEKFEAEILNKAIHKSRTRDSKHHAKVISNDLSPYVRLLVNMKYWWLSDCFDDSDMNAVNSLVLNRIGGETVPKYSILREASLTTA